MGLSKLYVGWRIAIWLAVAVAVAICNATAHVAGLTSLNFDFWSGVAYCVLFWRARP